MKCKGKRNKRPGDSIIEKDSLSNARRLKFANQDSDQGEVYPLCTCETEKHFNNHRDECELNKFDAMMRAIAGAAHGQARQVIAVDADGEIFERAWVVAELIEAHYMHFVLKVCLDGVHVSG